MKIVTKTETKIVLLSSSSFGGSATTSTISVDSELYDKAIKYLKANYWKMLDVITKTSETYDDETETLYCRLNIYTYLWNRDDTAISVSISKLKENGYIQ